MQGLWTLAQRRAMEKLKNVFPGLNSSADAAFFSPDSAMSVKLLEIPKESRPGMLSDIIRHATNFSKSLLITRHFVEFPGLWILPRGGIPYKYVHFPWYYKGFIRHGRRCEDCAPWHRVGRWGSWEIVYLELYSSADAACILQTAPCLWKCLESQ